MMLSFAPWLILKIVSVLPLSDPLTMLKTALVLATVVYLLQSRNATRGILFWGTGAFFAASLIMVVLMTNMWVVYHLGLLSQLTMNLVVWGSILLKRPFTLDYAKTFVPQSWWTNPVFLRKNYIITAIWGLYFALGLAFTDIRVYEPQVSSLLLELLDNGAMIGAILFTSHFSKHKDSPVRTTEMAQ
jgi:hypothetical protein